jgi:5-methylcytosine-specific restriction endonuclease McrA
VAYQSKYKKRFLRWKKNVRNHTARMKRAGTWHGLPRLTYVEWKSRLEEFDYRCGYCLLKFEEETLWLEHIVGVAEGGEHRLHNVIPSCQLCNQTKGDKSLMDFQGITRNQLFQRMKDHLTALKAPQD